MAYTFGWLVERAGNSYLCVEQTSKTSWVWSWTTDNDKALRFSREQDAMDAYGLFLTCRNWPVGTDIRAKVVEHGWTV